MRPEKKAVLDEFRERTEEARFLFVTDYTGLDVPRAGQLRRELGAVNARFQIVKNRLFRRVSDDRGWTGLSATLRGPQAVVFGKGDVTATARVLKTFAETHNLLPVTGGVLGDTFLSAAAIRDLAELPSREVLLARLVGTVAAPMTRLVGVVQQKLLSLLFVLQAIRDKRDRAGDRRGDGHHG